MKYLLFVLLPFFTLAGKSYQIEVKVRSKLESFPLSGVFVELQEENHKVHKGISDEKGIVIFSGIQSKKYNVIAYGDTSVYLPFLFTGRNSKKQDEELMLELIVKQDYFKLKCEELVDQFFESLGSILESDTSTICENESQTLASFPGGEAYLAYYFTNYFRYTLDAVDQGISGRIYMSFIVEADGSITKIVNLRGLSLSLDREAKRLIREMPRWIPGTCEGKMMRTKVMLPITVNTM